ncbi:MAG: hypothetical protein EXR21_04970, partial [Flavobacteriaceae bacterium]|nr:hypothetical protein [Flavobacteriaceae bacterium]
MSTFTCMHPVVALPQRKTLSLGKVSAFLSMLLLLLFANTGNAQISSNYSATKSYGTYTPITTAGGATTAASGALNYTMVPINVAIPSTPFNGSTFSNLCIYRGGYVAFSSSSSCVTYTQNPMTTGSYEGLIAAFTNYLYSANATLTPTPIPMIQYQQVGTEFVVQWTDASAFSGAAAAGRFGFQVRINTCNGVINTIYDSVLIQPTASTYPQHYVGIRGNSGGDYLNWNLASGAWHNASSSTSTATGCNIVGAGNKPYQGLQFTYTPTSAGALTLNSINYNTASVAQVALGANNQVITRLDLDVSGLTSSLNLNSIQVRSNNTNDADIGGVKLYYTNATSFNTNNQLGSTQTFSGGYATFSGLSKALTCGGNYVWVVYNISSGATVGNIADAKFDANSINVGGSTYPASNTSPGGSRTIATGMTFSTANAVQVSGYVEKGDQNKAIIQLKVDMSATGASLDVDQLVLNTAGSGTATNNVTTNVQNAKVYYTGNSSTFATTTQFSTTVAAPNGSLTFNGSQSLLNNSNYFWLTYDIKSTGTTSDSVDAKWTGLSIIGSNQTVTVQNPSGVRVIRVAYCKAPFSNLLAGVGLVNVSVGSINNTTAVPSAANVSYQDYTAISTNVSRNGAYTLSMTCGTYTATQHCFYAWADWDGNGVFTDAGEALGTSFLNTANTTVSFNFVVPCGASLGNTPLRVKDVYNIQTATPCQAITYGETEDYTLVVYDSALSYGTSYATQTVTSSVLSGSNNNRIIAVPVLIGGCNGVLNLTQMNFSSNGSTNAAADIDSAIVYWTGNSNVFATTTRFGAAGSINGAFTVSGTRSLSSDTNWMWLVYNLKGGASVGNVVDAECSQVTVGGNNYTPTNTAPSGSRGIDVLMTFNSANAIQPNTTAVPRGIRNELIGVVVNMSSGVSLNLTQLKFNLSGTTSIANDIDTIRVYYTGSSNQLCTAVQFGSGSLTGATILANPFSVNGTMALLPGDNYFWLAAGVKATAPVTDSIDAQCPQITIASPVGAQTTTVSSPTGKRKIMAAYCTATTTSFLAGVGITNVTLGDINNTTAIPLSAALSYTSYTSNLVCGMTTTLQRSSSQTLQVTNSTYTGTVQYCGVWIDWDQSGVFDATEFTIAAPGGPTNTFSLPFTVPCSAALGQTRMRVKFSYNGTFAATTACNGSPNYGEIEDYTVVISDSALTYVSSTTIQGPTTSVGKPSTNNAILQMQVVTAGCSGSLPMTSFSMNTTGCTDPNSDISAVKIYYTGSSATFSTTTLYHSVGTQNGSYAITHPTTFNLTNGDNNFWLTYDIDAGATSTDYVDAQFTSANVNGTGYSPSITSPAGDRQILIPMTYTSHTWTKVTSNTIQSALRQVVVGAEITMSSGTSVNLDSIIFNTTGTTNPANDIQNARVYYTGTSNAYSTSTQLYNQTTAAPSNSIFFGGTQGLLPGTNYFWLTYDIKAAAPTTDSVTGAFTRFRVNGTSYTVTPASLSGKRKISAPYCASYNTNVTDDDIGGIMFRDSATQTTIYQDGSQTPVVNNPQATGLNQVSDSTSKIINLKRLGLYNNTVYAVMAAGVYYANMVACFIDYNQDGTFGANELVWGSTTAASAGTPYHRGSFSVPCSAALGQTRMRFVLQETTVAITSACGTYTWGETVDYSVVISDSVAAYISSTTSQNNTSYVAQGSTNAQIMAIPIIAAGCGGAVPVTQFNLSTSGSTAASSDITTAKIFYTGNSNVFGTGTQFGTTSNPSGSFNVTGSQNLLGDTNWFWLAYNIAGGATNTNVVDAQCASIIVNGSTKTPSVTSPSGNREINTPMTFNSVTWQQYNTGATQNSTNNLMSRVIVNMSSGASINLDSVVAATAFTGTGPITSDATNAKVFYTGSSSSFATTTQFGSTIAAPNGAMRFAGATPLVSGDNNFWITYNVPSGAVVGDSIAAPVSKVTINGSDQNTSAATAIGKRRIMAPYCASYNTNVTDDDIGGIVILRGTDTVYKDGSATPVLNNSTATIINQTNDMTATIINMQRKASYSFTMYSVMAANFWYSGGITVYIDYNQDGDFIDAGEQVFAPTAYCTQADNKYTFTMQVPCSAGLGTTRMRLVNQEGIMAPPSCGITTWGETIDYTINFSDSAVGYVSSTTTQTNTSSVFQGQTNAQIMEIPIVANGCGGAVPVTQFSLNTNGSTAASNISNAKVYYTGNSNVFATTTSFGTKSSPSGAFTVSGTQNLTSDTNWFWVAYNIASGATLTHVVDVECSSFIFNGSSQTPTVTAPSGNRPINNPMTFNNLSWIQYNNNVPRGSTNAYVTRVNVNMNSGASINMDSLVANTAFTGTGPITTDVNSAKVFFTGTSTVFATTTQYSSTIAAPNGAMRFAGTVALQPGNNYFWITYVIPIGAVINDSVAATLSKVTLAGTNQTASAAVTSGKRKVVVAYCTVAATSMCCGFGIKKVAIGSINNTTNTPQGTVSPYADSYTDYTSMSTNIGRYISTTLTLQAGTYANGNQNIAAWIDWNQDGDFVDAGEKLGELVGMAVGTDYNMVFTVPCTATLGQTRLRVKHQYATTFIDPCVSSSNIEVEDYTVNVVDNQRQIVAQNNTNPQSTSVSQGSTNQAFLRMEAIMTGCATTYPLTNLTMNTAGTNGTYNATSNLTNAKIFYTGNSAAFATTTQFGSTITSPNGSMSFTGSQSLLTPDTVNFWLTYDIKATANLGDTVDASLTSATILGVTQNAPAGNPTGYRLIANPMTYNSATLTMPVTNNVIKGTTGVRVVLLKVNTSATGSSIPMSRVTLNTAGCTAPTTDITNAKLFFTGNSSTFATTTQYGTTIAAPNGTLVFTSGSTNLFNNDNYLWLTYDVPVTAVTNDSITAMWDSVTVGGSAKYNSSTISTKRRIVNQYCAPVWTATLGETGIKQVTVGSINNVTTAIGPGTVQNFTAQSTTMQRYTSVTMTVKTGTYDYYNLTGVWVDWNQDGTYQTSERVFTNHVYTNGVGAQKTFTFSIYVPCSATLGTTRMRVLNEYYTLVASTASPCALNTNYGECEDYTVNVTDSTYSVASVVSTTAATSDVLPGSTNQAILKTKVQMSGCSGLFTTRQLDYNTNGTTAASDITNARVYFTGNSNIFATTTQFGSTATPSGAFSVTGSKIVTADSQFYWLAYDIASGATPGNLVDAEGTVATVNSATYGSSTAPSGSRTINNPMSMNSYVTEQVTGTVTKGSTRNQVLRVKLNMSAGSAWIAKTLDFTIAGTTDATNDIGTVRAFFTGSSSTFATTTQLGTYSNPIYSFTINCNQTVAVGDNYFWLAYDVPSGAATYDSIDGTFEGGTFDSAGTTISQVPSVTDPSGRRVIINAYCTSYNINQADDDIGGIMFRDSLTQTTIYSDGAQTPVLNNTTATGINATTDMTNVTINLKKQGLYNFTAYAVMAGATYFSNMLGVFIDYNQDGTFGSNERVWGSTTPAAVGTPYHMGYFSVPCSAILGSTRMRFVLTETTAAITAACGTYTWGETVDYKVNIADSTYNVVSVIADQLNTNDVFASASNQEIARVRAITGGCPGTLNLSALSLNTNGSTSASNDISNAKLYYTGTTNAFATTTLVGTTASPNGSFSITGSQNLAPDTNYFWLAYDMASGATTGNTVDIEVNNATISSNTYTPATTAPSGDRDVNVPMTYTSSTVACAASNNVSVGTRYARVARIDVSMSTGAPINMTQFNLSTNGSTNTSDFDTIRVFYTGNSNTFTTTTQFGTYVGANGSFNVTGNLTMNSGTNYFWVTYKVKTTATTGDSITVSCTQMTIGGTNQTPTATSPGCKRKIIPAYCKPTCTNTLAGLLLARVKIGSLDNANGAQPPAPYYTDFSETISSTNIQVGTSQTLEVTPGTYAFGVNVAAWIDLNQDGDFGDANEKLGELNSIAVTGSAANLNFTLPTTGISLGETRMRVRLVYNSTNLQPCATYTYGEAEDYAVTLTPPSTPTPAITPTAPTFCQGVGQVFSVTGGAQAGYTYTWKEGSTTMYSGVGSPYNQYNYNPSYNGSFNITCVVTDPFSQSGTSNTAATTINPNAIAGTASIQTTGLCAGQYDTLYLTGYTGTIQWQSKVGAGAWTAMASQTNDIESVQPSATTQYRAKVSYGSCNVAYSNIVTVTIGATSVWIGAYSTNWNIPNNWCNGSVPTASSIVTISASANQPVIISAASCSTLTINAGAVLTLNNGANLAVNGAYVKNSTGTLVHNGGQLNLAQAQDIPGQAYYYLKLSGAGSYRFTGNTSIANYLVIPNATTFVSDSGYTITCPGDVTNNGTIQSNGSG